MTARLSPLLDISWPNVVELLRHVLCFDRAIHTIVVKMTAVETTIFFRDIQVDGWRVLHVEEIVEQYGPDMAVAGSFFSA